MDKGAKKQLRCAIYTRKSTEHNLDLEFNSLDAQREACEAYIKSQAHEGWRLVPHHYDDGAFSGASLDRPALQSLLAEVRSGKVDTIVVYKVDRLTRSLADFAKLVELFDQHSASFVSVTQHFNTTSSMGRLTLNVLLSFAQFEREVIGERVRDKIAASKRKGIWVGGSVPLGYASVNKKLVVVPEEAETVRFIFRRYLELGSIGALVKDLDKKGIRTRRRAQSDGTFRGGIRFGVGSLSYLLRNRFLIAEVVYQGAVHKGEHEPILNRALFAAVQAKLAAGANVRQLKLRASPAILTGRIFDDRGNKMTPTHTNKKGARYRYYVSHPVLQKQLDQAGTVRRISAPEVEATVVQALRSHLTAAGVDGDSGEPAGDSHLVDGYVQRVVIKADFLDIWLRNGIDGGAEVPAEADEADVSSADPTPTALTVPWTAGTFAEVKGILHSPSEQGPTMSSSSREALLTAIAKARIWVDDLTQARALSFHEIAQREGKVERHIRLLAPLAFVSPKIIREIIQGEAVSSVTITSLAKRLAYSWRGQVD